MGGIVKEAAHFLCRLNTQRKVYQEHDGEIVELNFSAIVKFMRDMNRLEQVLSDGKSTMGKYLVNFLQLSSKKHILEKKKYST